MFIPCKQPAFYKVFHTQWARADRQQPIKEPSLKYYPFLLWNVSSLVEIAIYIWLESIGDTTEFQFDFRNRVTWNYIFQASNCKRIILIFSLVEEGSKRGLFRNYYLVSSRYALSLRRGIDGVVWRDQTTAAKEKTVSVVPIHFIFA